MNIADEDRVASLPPLLRLNDAIDWKSPDIVFLLFFFFAFVCATGKNEMRRSWSKRQFEFVGLEKNSVSQGLFRTVFVLKFEKSEIRRA